MPVADSNRFRPTLLERLTRRQTQSQAVLAVFDDKKLESLGLTARSIGKTLGLMGFRSSEGWLSSVVGRSRIVFDGFPQSMDAERLRRIHLPTIDSDSSTMLGELGNFRMISVKQGAEPVLDHRDVERAVVHDLQQLFETTCLEATVSLGDRAHVRRSVLNYGVPGIVGMFIAGAEPEAMAEELRETIAFFEPRLLESTLSVSCDAQKSDYGIQALTFHIEARYEGQPADERLHLTTEFEIEGERLNVASVETLR